jgi:hypothetical protein
VRDRFIVVSGLPASGKSTLGRAVANAVQLPLLDKDQILEGLFDSLGVGNAAWRSRLSRAADEVLREQVCTLSGAVIASWWRHPLSTAESGTPVEWLAALPGELVELHCLCSPKVAASRFIGRERHAGHLDGQCTHAALLANLEQHAYLGPLRVGRLVQVSTEAIPNIPELVAKICCSPSENAPDVQSAT